MKTIGHKIVYKIYSSFCNCACMYNKTERGYAKILVVLILETGITGDILFFIIFWIFKMFYKVHVITINICINIIKRQ